MRRALILTVLLALAGALVPAPAPAVQEALQVRLTEITPWLGPESTLRIVLSVTNRSPQQVSDVKVGLSIFGGVGSRSELAQAFGGRLRERDVVGKDTLAEEDAIQPGATWDVVVEKELSEFTNFRTGRADNRAYPVRITVTAGRTATAQVDTQVVYFARPAGEPLLVALIVPLHVPPLYDAGGAVVRSAAQAAFGDGRIDRLLDALAAHPGVPVTLAPSGLLLDTLADLSDGFILSEQSGREPVGPSDPVAVRAGSDLEKIRGLARRPETRFMVTPYSAAFLPGLIRNELADRAQAQVGEGRRRLVNQLGYEPLPDWLLPAGGLLDEPTLSVLQRSGVSKAVLHPDSVRLGEGARAPTLTPSAPATLETRAGAVEVIVQDAGLLSVLASKEGLSPAQTRQQFLAETATIMLERPAQRRAVAVATPPDWAPDPLVVNGILDALERSPWVRGGTPDEMVAQVAERGNLRMASSQEVMAAGPRLPPEEYFESLRSARRRIDQFSELGPPTGMLADLDQKLLIAASADWWTSRTAVEQGRSFTRQVEEAVRREFAKIRAPAAQTITFTSRTGTIPLLVESRAEYPVKVLIRLDSDKLEFPGTERCPDGRGFCLRRDLEPRAQTVDVRAIAQASGRFPLMVTLLTPSGQVVLDSSRIVVRSTAYNVVAVTITAGAGVFLVLWWIVGTVRKRLPARLPA